MKCFIHPNAEATAMCKKCGKAMCIDCSAYSQHSGVCPECRCEEFIATRAGLMQRAGSLLRSFVGLLALGLLALVIAVVVAATVSTAGLILLAGTGIAVIAALLKLKNRKRVNADIESLTIEINKLQLALKRGVGAI